MTGHIVVEASHTDLRLDCIFEAPLDFSPDGRGLFLHSASKDPFIVRDLPTHAAFIHLRVHLRIVRPPHSQEKAPDLRTSHGRHCVPEPARQGSDPLRKRSGARTGARPRHHAPLPAAPEFPDASFVASAMWPLATRYLRRASTQEGCRCPASSAELRGRCAEVCSSADRWGRRSASTPTNSRIVRANSNQLHAPALAACTSPVVPPAMSCLIRKAASAAYVGDITMSSTTRIASPALALRIIVSTKLPPLPLAPATPNRLETRTIRWRGVDAATRCSPANLEAPYTLIGRGRSPSRYGRPSCPSNT